MRSFRVLEKDLEPAGYEIHVEGELDLAVADELKEALERAGSEHDQVLISLQRCEFIDSTGLAVILHACHQMADEGRTLKVYGASSQVLRTLQITGLTDNGLVFKNAKEARAASAGSC